MTLQDPGEWLVVRKAQMDTSEDQGHSGPSGLSRGARGDVDHDQNDVHF